MKPEPPDKPEFRRRPEREHENHEIADAPVMTSLTVYQTAMPANRPTKDTGNEKKRR